MSKYSDIHSHPHMKSYLWMEKKKKKFTRKGKYDPWTIVVPNLYNNRRDRLGIREALFGMASSYNQADMVKLWNGNVKVVYGSLYPIEREFARGKEGKIRGKKKLLKSILRVITHHNSPIRDLLQSYAMTLPTYVVNRIQSDAYDYWHFLNDEYKFLITKDRIETQSNFLYPGFLRKLFTREKKLRSTTRNKIKIMDAKGTYLIPKTKSDVEKARAYNHIIMPLTIEGGHALGSDQLNTMDHWPELKRRIDHLKQQWEHPVFFITFAHHFNNYLCGHAHSLPDFGKLLYDQSDGMYQGFSELGLNCIRKLLSIDKNNNDNLEADGYRILIDVKHMNAKSRKYFYDKIINPRYEDENKVTIPVIASHVAYCGKATLIELIDYHDKESDADIVEDKLYNPWNINICDEDVYVIFKTGGLIGLSFDQRILGVPESQKKITGGRNNINSVWNSIKAIVNVVYNAKESDVGTRPRKEAWQTLNIGTDFEGLIDPVNTFKTAVEFNLFREALINIIKSERDASSRYAFYDDFNSSFTIENAVDSICYQSSYDFLYKHFPK